jgi:hypothetical protein
MSSIPVPGPEVVDSVLADLIALGQLVDAAALRSTRARAPASVSSDLALAVALLEAGNWHAFVVAMMHRDISVKRVRACFVTRGQYADVATRDRRVATRLLGRIAKRVVGTIDTSST